MMANGTQHALRSATYKILMVKVGIDAAGSPCNMSEVLENQERCGGTTGNCCWGRSWIDKKRNAHAILANLQAYPNSSWLSRTT